MSRSGLYRELSLSVCSSLAGVESRCIPRLSGRPDLAARGGLRGEREREACGLAELLGETTLLREE